MSIISLALIGLATQSTAAGTCANWRGWDPVAKRDLCGPPIKPATNGDLEGLKLAHGSLVRAAGQADYVYACNLRSLSWQMAVQARAESALLRDSRLARLSGAQRHDLMTWKVKLQDQTLADLQRMRRPCASLQGSAFLLRLDRLAYSVR